MVMDNAPILPGSAPCGAFTEGDQQMGPRNRRISTHRVLQINVLLDDMVARANMYRRCAGAAANIGNRTMAIRFVNRAQKCDSIRARCYLVLSRDYCAKVPA